MSKARKSGGSAKKPRIRAGRMFGRILYLVVALLLIGWEVQESHLYQSESCNLRTSVASESLLMTPLYKRVLKSANLKDSQQVSMVAIESGLSQIQSNVCLGRGFMADVLDAIAGQGQMPAVIAIDKFYGRDSCPQDDPNTARLLQSITALHIPVVVGAPTQNSSASNTSSCLALTPQLFSPQSAMKPPNVYSGLTRLNENALKIPLVWSVFAKAGDTQLAAEDAGDSFALTTVKQTDLKLTQTNEFKALLKSPQQPYANVADPLESQTATNLLCTAGTPEVVKRWNLDCSGHTQKMNLSGKVVLIGAESATDDWSVMDRDMYGFELQAHYIAALLGGAYLRDISAAWLLLPLLLYYCLAELLLPYMAIHEHPVWPLRHVRHPALWEMGLFAVTMLIGYFVPLWFHRFPPVGLMLIMAAIFIPRLLIESWALLNEDMEEAEEEEPSA